MARPGKHQKKYDKYKNSGKLQTNKQLKAERDEKRKEHFRKRKEEGKCYKYEKNPYEKGSYEYMVEKFYREEKNKSKKTEPQFLRSFFAKVDNEIEAEVKAMKASGNDNNGKGRRHTPRGKNFAADEVDDM